MLNNDVVIRPPQLEDAREIAEAHNLWAQGIGTLLLRGAEDWLLDLGYSSACLWVEQSNERAITFYTGAGWAADGASKQDAAYSPPVTAKRYRKLLT
jgi:GNAT superfamily N-acetyltransferase